MASPVGLQPNYARVTEPDGNAGAKEYVPVNAEHERLIAEGHGSAEAGFRTQGMFGPSSKVRVRFNCTYDVMGADGRVTQRRAGHEHVFDPKNEKMNDRACDGIRFRNPTFEEEVLAMGPRGSGKVYPRFLGWDAVPASRLQPEMPRSFGVKVGGR